MYNVRILYVHRTMHDKYRCTYTIRTPTYTVRTMYDVQCMETVLMSKVKSSYSLITLYADINVYIKWWIVWYKDIIQTAYIHFQSIYVTFNQWISYFYIEYVTFTVSTLLLQWVRYFYSEYFTFTVSTLLLISE